MTCSKRIQILDNSPPSSTCQNMSPLSALKPFCGLQQRLLFCNSPETGEREIKSAGNVGKGEVMLMRASGRRDNWVEFELKHVKKSKFN